MRRFGKIFNIRIVFILRGLCVGIFAALCASALRAAVSGGGRLLTFVSDVGRAHPVFIPMWFCVLAAAAGAVTLLLKCEPYISGSGIPQAEAELLGYIEQKWWRVLLAKLAGGVISISAGLALGREGPSVQLGAMAGKGFSRITGGGREDERLLITCGASAGLSAAFNAPLAGVLFAVEELRKGFSADVLISCMASSVSAAAVSRLIFGGGPVLDFSGAPAVPLKQYWLVLILGMILGCGGAFYNFCIPRAQAIFAKIKIKYIRILIPFMLAGILTFVCPAATGGGSGLITAAGSGAYMLSALLLLLALRFCFSVVSFSSGAPGGIFLPLLVIGALAGGVASCAAAALGLDVSMQSFIILGMAGYFSAVVRSPATGVILICEMTGGFVNILPAAAVSLAAYAAAELLRSEPIYDILLHRLTGGADASHERVRL